MVLALTIFKTDSIPETDSDSILTTNYTYYVPLLMTNIPKLSLFGQ